MKKLVSILLTLAVAVSLFVVPAAALANDVGTKVVVYTDSLNLENKNSSNLPWVILDTDTIKATLLYNDGGDKFEWSLEGEVVLPSTEYSLIYYADQPDRFVDWGGNNPGALIATMTSGSASKISGSGSINLGMNLPCYPDANMDPDEYDYSSAIGKGKGTGDMYANANGAKIWLVPTEDLPADWVSNGGWMTWAPDNILFETDLITYTDTNLIISISLSTSSLDFGKVVAGETAGPLALTVQNNGTTPIVVLASASSGLFEDLLLSGTALDAYGPLLYAGKSDVLAVTLPIPTTQTKGEVTGTLTFIAHLQRRNTIAQVESGGEIEISPLQLPKGDKI